MCYLSYFVSVIVVRDRFISDGSWYIQCCWSLHGVGCTRLNLWMLLLSLGYIRSCPWQLSNSTSWTFFSKGIYIVWEELWRANPGAFIPRIPIVWGCTIPSISMSIIFNFEMISRRYACRIECFLLINMASVQWGVKYASYRHVISRPKITNKLMPMDTIATINMFID